VNSTGIIDYLRGDYPRALERFHEALKLGEDAGDYGEILSALNNIGEIYRLQGEYTQAIAYLSRSRELSERAGSKRQCSTRSVT
jgi:tetratricopeptide (TPR) repeat protein